MAGACLILPTMFSPESGRWSPKVDSDESLTVMTFNLRHGRADDGLHAWRRRKRAVAAVLERHRPDVVGFQEVNDFQMNFLIEALSNHCCLSDRKPRGRGWEYRPIFVGPKVAPLKVETFTLSATPEKSSRSWGSRYVRQATRARVSFAGREMSLYNTHLDFAPATQLRQAKVIWQRIEAKDRPRPVILLGDFNASPHSATYRFLIGDEAFVGSRGDFEDASPRPQPFTFHRFSGQPRGGHIDWILFRQGLELVRPAEVIYERHQGLYPSDHFPLQAVLTFSTLE